LKQVPARAHLLAFIESYEEVGSLPDGVDPFMEMERRLNASGAGVFGLSRLVGGDLVEMPVIDARTFVKQTYFRAIDVAGQMYTEAREGRPLTVKNVKRVVQNFVDVLWDKQPDTIDLLILLTDIKNWKGYLPNHSVNTTVLSLFIGKAPGLDRVGLRDLGMAAMLADIGNAVLPDSVLDSEGPLSDEQRKIMQSHPIRGVPILTRFQDLDSGAIESGQSAHALRPDHLGV
jgi:HD-GYP domain-containing protein (c-di-GMP phosphodiesterase class II)